MGDYNRDFGYKYGHQWVNEMSLQQLSNLPPEVLDELQLSEEQRAALAGYIPEEVEQDILANEFDKLNQKNKD